MKSQEVLIWLITSSRKKFLLVVIGSFLVAAVGQQATAAGSSGLKQSASQGLTTELAFVNRLLSLYNQSINKALKDLGPPLVLSSIAREDVSRINYRYYDFNGPHRYVKSSTPKQMVGGLDCYIWLEPNFLNRKLSKKVEVRIFSDQKTRLIKFVGIQFLGSGWIDANGYPYDAEVALLPIAHDLWTSSSILTEAKPQAQLDAVRPERSIDWKEDRFYEFFFLRASGLLKGGVVRVGLVSKESTILNRRPEGFQPLRFVRNYNWRQARVLGLYVGSQAFAHYWPFIPFGRTGDQTPMKR